MRAQLIRYARTLAALLIASAIGAGAPRPVVAEAAADETAFGEWAEWATLAVEASDRIGRRAAVPFIVIHPDTGREVTRAEDEALKAQLPPGRYLVSPVGNDQVIEPVTLSAGESRTVRLGERHSLWVRLSKGAERTLLRFRPPSEMKAVLAHHYDPDKPFVRNVRYLPRPGAEAADRSRVLELARAWRDELKAKLKPATDDPDTTRRDRKRWFVTDDMCRNALTLFGDRSDIPPASHAPDHAAYMEARLGRLTDGTVMGLAESGDLYEAAMAAAALSHYGIEGFKPVMVEALENSLETDPDGALSRSELVEALGRSPSVEALAVFRKLHRRGREIEACRKRAREAGKEYDELGHCGDPMITYAGERAVPYLIAHGDTPVWRMLADFGPRFYATVDHLAALTAEVGPALDRDLSLVWFQRFAQLVNELAYDLRTHRPWRVPGLLDRLRKRSFERTQETYKDVSSDILHKKYYHVRLSGSWPNAHAAGWYYRGLGFQNPKILEPRWRVDGTRWKLGEGALLGPDYLVDARLTWYPEPQFLDQYLEKLFADDDGWKRLDDILPQLDYVEHEALTEAIEPYLGQSRLRDFVIDFVLAYHKTMTTQHTAAFNHFADGLETRPYLLREAQDDDFGGALSGVLQLRPGLSEDGERLRLGLRLHQRAHYFAGLSGLARKIKGMTRPEAFDIHQYVKDRGRKLIRSVRLFRVGGESIELEAAGADEEGFFIFTHEGAGPDLAGLYAVVEFEFFDERPRFIFDLFASDFARTQRKHGSATASTRPERTR